MALATIAGMREVLIICRTPTVVPAGRACSNKSNEVPAQLKSGCLKLKTSAKSISTHESYFRYHLYSSTLVIGVSTLSIDVVSIDILRNSGVNHGDESRLESLLSLFLYRLLICNLKLEDWQTQQESSAQYLLQLREFNFTRRLACNGWNYFFVFHKHVITHTLFYKLAVHNSNYEMITN